MVILYTVVDVKLLNPVKFPYPANVQERLRDLILGLNHPVKFPYLVKVSMHKFAYFLKALIISFRNHQVKLF